MTANSSHDHITASKAIDKLYSFDYKLGFHTKAQRNMMLSAVDSINAIELIKTEKLSKSLSKSFGVRKLTVNSNMPAIRSLNNNKLSSKYIPGLANKNTSLQEKNIDQAPKSKVTQQIKRESTICALARLLSNYSVVNSNDQ